MILTFYSLLEQVGLPSKFALERSKSHSIELAEAIAMPFIDLGHGQAVRRFPNFDISKMPILG
jgi:hypothetical protein